MSEGKAALALPRIVCLGDSKPALQRQAGVVLQSLSKSAVSDA